MVKTIEGTFTVSGDVKLHTKTWIPDGPPKAKLVLFHGFSDHADRYYDMFPSLARRGVIVYGFDQRGWGRSARAAGDRGRCGPTSLVLADMSAFLEDRLAAEPAEAPLFVLAHSMGGGQALTLASTPEYADLVRRVRGWVLNAPFVDFATELRPSRLLVVSGRLASHVMPNFQMHQPIPPENVTRLPEVAASIAADALCHNYGTLEGMAGMLDRADGLTSGALALTGGGAVRALLLAHGTADKATSFDRSRDWFDRQSHKVKDRDATFKTYEGAYHQLHADVGQEQFYQDVGEWIEARIGDAAPNSGGGPEVEAETPKL